MTDMQDTITQLRNQLAELRSSRSASSGVSLPTAPLPAIPPPPPPPPAPPPPPPLLHTVDSRSPSVKIVQLRVKK